MYDNLCACMLDWERGDRCARSDWYIVACPRAACPFDAEEQAQEYPPGHTQRMVLLADELQGIAAR